MRQTLKEYLLEVVDNKDELAIRLLRLDSTIEKLHGRGLAIYDFNVNKIHVIDGMIDLQSFFGLLGSIEQYHNMKENNILQAAKIGIFTYNNMETNASINQEMFEFIAQNISMLNRDGMVIPEDIYEYYEEIFLNGNFDYLNNFLVKKQQKLSGDVNTNTYKKNLSTAIGRAFISEETAYVNILFIPSIATLLYLILVVGYMLFS